ncbi:MAG: LysM peptidoglycan-binding domain-containing protein [Trueperaceae bacterium]|nr:LysM peptidoglycan-binding domain-containing protein [Trueperaceae bacterium]
MFQLRGFAHACTLVVVLGASTALANTITVRPGDSLWALARAHGTTAAELMAANGLQHDALTPGQVLTLPDQATDDSATDDAATTAAADPAPTTTAPATPTPAQAGPAPSTATAATPPATHVVEAGDNLWSLARRYDTTVAALMATNGLTDESLRLGTTLRVPSTGDAAAAGAPAAPTATHVVEAGDNLWSLARRYDTTVASLMAANALTSDALRPGLELTVPVALATAPQAASTSSAAAPSTEVTPSGAAAAAPTPAAAPAALSVTVREGDSLYEIALAHDVRVDDLIVWNDLDGTLIRPGQVLDLFAREGTPSAAPLVVHVASGDSLWTLARVHGTTVDALAAANGIATNGTLRVGQALTVPGRYAAVHATSGAAGADVGGAATTEVRVVPGDNLWKIARQHNTTVAALMALNGLPHDRLQVGQTLNVVPGPSLGAVSAAAAPAPAISNGMVWPLVGQITSRFGYRRLVVSRSNMHYGLDIDGEIGDPIRSATEGTITFSGWRGGFGNLVVVTQGETEYLYAHASALLVQEGQSVSAGQPIARVGATGTVTGSHLHFEIRVAGTAVDPLPILEARASR